MGWECRSSAGCDKLPSCRRARSARRQRSPAIKKISTVTTKKVEKNPFQLCFAQEVDDDQRRASCCKIMSRTCFTTFLASGSKRETASNCERWSSFILAEEQVIRSDVKGLRQSLDDIESGLWSATFITLQLGDRTAHHLREVLLSEIALFPSRKQALRKPIRQVHCSWSSADVSCRQHKE